MTKRQFVAVAGGLLLFGSGFAVRPYVDSFLSELNHGRVRYMIAVRDIPVASSDGCPRDSLGGVRAGTPLVVQRKGPWAVLSTTYLVIDDSLPVRELSGLEKSELWDQAFCARKKR